MFESHDVTLFPSLGLQNFWKAVSNSLGHFLIWNSQPHSTYERIFPDIYVFGVFYCLTIKTVNQK